MSTSDLDGPYMSALALLLSSDPKSGGKLIELAEHEITSSVHWGSVVINNSVDVSSLVSS